MMVQLSYQITWHQSLIQRIDLLTGAFKYKEWSIEDVHSRFIMMASFRTWQYWTP